MNIWKAILDIGAHVHVFVLVHNQFTFTVIPAATMDPTRKKGHFTTPHRSKEQFPLADHVLYNFSELRL
jgi:hypothetical protein